MLETRREMYLRRWSELYLQAGCTSSDAIVEGLLRLDEFFFGQPLPMQTVVGDPDAVIQVAVEDATAEAGDGEVVSVPPADCPNAETCRLIQGGIKLSGGPCECRVAAGKPKPVVEVALECFEDPEPEPVAATPPADPEEDPPEGDEAKVLGAFDAGLRPGEIAEAEAVPLRDVQRILRENGRA